MQWGMALAKRAIFSPIALPVWWYIYGIARAKRGRGNRGWDGTFGKGIARLHRPYRDLGRGACGGVWRGGVGEAIGDGMERLARILPDCVAPTM